MTNEIEHDARRGGRLLVARRYSYVLKNRRWSVRFIGDPMVTIGFICGSSETTAQLSSTLARGLMVVAARRDLPAVMTEGAGPWRHGVEPICMTHAYARQLDPWTPGEFPWWACEPLDMFLHIDVDESIDANTLDMIGASVRDPRIFCMPREAAP